MDFNSTPDAELQGLEGVELYAPDTAPEKLPPYLAQLNQPQREAALTVEGPLIVLAGAGSGKTKMLTTRIAYLVGHCRVPAYQVLAVTFTNKAAGEMRDRVDHILHQQAQDETGFSGLVGSPEIGTFHSICVRIMRREMEYTGFEKPFVIYDDSDQLSLVKSVMKKLNIDPKSFNPKSIQGAINRVKCDAIEPQEMEPSQFSLFEKKLKQVYTEYQKQLQAANALDFGEIICKTFRLLRDNPELRHRYQRRYRYIHVDEYQDTNRAQYLLLSMLASPAMGGHSSICVVGDEDQSIYGWRGADINNILDFEKEYKGARMVKLEQNYRSTKCIIGAASHVIGNNTQRKDKVLWTSNEEGDRVQHIQFADERDEADAVVKEMQKIVLEKGCTFDDFAILYRTHAQSRQFEDTLRKMKISYQIIGGLRFYDRKEIKDVLAYFRVILNPGDTVSVKRVINTPARGIGKTTIDKIDTAVNERQLQGEEGVTFWSVLEEIAEGHSAFAARTAGKLTGFVQMIQRFQLREKEHTLTELYHLVLDEVGMVRQFRKEDTPEADSRIENLEEFETILQEFEEELVKDAAESEKEAKLAENRGKHLAQFLEQITLSSNVDAPLDPSAVRLMTLHGCKGLEFPIVFLVGMEEGLFPSFRPWEDTPDEEIEEERRLCYVGMTRAKDKLYLTNASVRRIWGSMHYSDPARFIGEIPFDLIRSRNMAEKGFTPERSASYSSKTYDEYAQEEVDYHSDSSSDSGASGQMIGRKLQHPEYGLGTILSMDGFGEGQKVTVEFLNKSRRKFLLKYVASYLR